MATRKNSKRLHPQSLNPYVNYYKETFPRFIVLESIEKTPLSTMSPFLIQKVITQNITAKTVKKLRNGTLLVEIENQKYANSLLKMNQFHNLKVKAYPHERLHFSKGVICSRELTLCSIEEIKKQLKNQGVTEVKRITTKIEGKIKETNIYIMTFNTPTTPKELKIGYNIEKMEQYIPNPLKCFKCQRYGHHQYRYTCLPVCGRCGEQDIHIDCQKNYQLPGKPSCQFQKL